MAEKERRVFAGYYKRYDGKHIFVVTTAKDYESQEDTVIFIPLITRTRISMLQCPKKILMQRSSITEGRCGSLPVKRK